MHNRFNWYPIWRRINRYYRFNFLHFWGETLYLLILRIWSKFTNELLTYLITWSHTIRYPSSQIPPSSTRLLELSIVEHAKWCRWHPLRLLEQRSFTMEKGGDSHITGEMRCICCIMYAKLKCRGGQPLHHNSNALRYIRFIMNCSLSLNYIGISMIEPESCISCF